MAVHTSDSSVGTEGRRYGGANADQRRERRRAALIEAGLELFGRAGYPNVSVKRVCEQAGLTQRYFYESFNDRAGLLIAVYDDCVAVAREATLDAVGEYLGDGAALAHDDVPAAVRSALGAFLEVLARDPRRARVILVEVVGVDPLVERVRMNAIHGWADLLLTLTRGDLPISHKQRLSAVGLVGAVTQLLVDWYFGSVAPVFADGDQRSATSAGGRTGADELADILDVCVDMFVSTHHHALATE